MKLTPVDIKAQEFNKSLRGYDSTEVKAFLEKLANQVEDLLVANERLTNEIEEHKRSVENYKKIEKNLQDSLRKVQESNTRSLETNRKQAAMTIKEAEMKASQIIDGAKASANEIRNAVLTLREEKELIISKLKAIIKTQGNLLEGKGLGIVEEEDTTKRQKAKDNLDVNVDDIVDKLL